MKLAMLLLLAGLICCAGVFAVYFAGHKITATRDADIDNAPLPADFKAAIKYGRDHPKKRGSLMPPCAGCGGGEPGLVLIPRKTWVADETDGKPPAVQHSKKVFVCRNEYGEPAVITADGKWARDKPECWQDQQTSEAIDVPAVQVETNEGNWPLAIPADKQNCERVGFKWRGPGYCVVPEYRYTCNPKTLILLHDENNPPVWWCHRVQP